MGWHDPKRFVSDLTFDNLLLLCEGKIPAKASREKGPILGALNGGNYIGRPGKDIYYLLPELTDEQFDILVEKHSKQYPMIAPGNHLGNAACLRYIYGQFTKQGILRSKNDKNRMANEKLDWVLARKFICALQEQFKKNNNNYGLSVSCEMEAHRLGDEAVLRKDRQKLDKMLEMYMESVKYAHESNSYKQMFTPYYWASCYFHSFGENKLALKYSKKTIKEAEKYCPDSRRSYVEKLIVCAKYMRYYDKKGWSRWRKKFAPKVKNRCVSKLFSKM